MKNLLIFIALLILLPFISKPQSSFEFILYDTIQSSAYITFEDMEDYFVTVGFSRSGDFDIDGVVLKYKDQNDIVSKSFHKEDTAIFFREGFLLPNGNYFIIGNIDDKMDYYLKNLYILELDPELTIIQERIYSIPQEYNSLGIIDFLIDSDSTVIISGVVDDPAPGIINVFFMAKLDFEGNLLNMKINPEYEIDYASELLQKPDESGYYLLGGIDYYDLLKIDNEFNVYGYLPLISGHLFITPVGAKWLSNGNLFTGSLAMQDVGSFYDLRVRICDTNLVAFKDTIIVDDGMNVLPAEHGIDFIDEDNIWTVTYPQFGFENKEWQYGRIYIFDSEMNVKGAKYFGGTMSLYLNSIKATNDGGCIITGHAADGQDKGLSDIYIKKVMPEDILTNAEETPALYDSDVLIYPVPFSDRFYIETYRENLSFRLISNTGNVILDNKPLQIPTTLINSADLKNGIYFYSIQDGNKIIQTGKIIKK